MRKDTLWETVCIMAGKDGNEPVRLEEALERAAPSNEIGMTEIKRLLKEGLLEEAEPGVLRLTHSGRTSCSELHGTAAVLAPDPESSSLS